MTKAKLRDILAKNIRELRQKRGWTQAQLAKRAKLTGRYISLLEQGDRNVTLDTLEGLAKALAVSAASLIVDPVDPPNAKDAIRLAVRLLENLEAGLD